MSRGAGRSDRNRSVRTLSRAGVRGTLPWYPFPGPRVRCPPRERPTSRPCSTDESVAAQHRCQRCAARVSHGLVPSPRSSRTRRCPTVPCAPKRSGPRWSPSEPKPEVRPGKVPPVGRPPGGVSVRFPAASGEGGPQHPFVGCSRRPVRRLLPGLVSPRRPRSLSGSESREPRSDSSPPLPRGSRRGRLAGLHEVFDVKEHFRGSAPRSRIQAAGASPPTSNPRCDAASAVSRAL
jgi:hypothetical protein